MKFATKEELEAHQAATVRGGIEGFAAGLALSLPASFYAQRTSTYYRALPIQLKALGVVLVVGPLFAIQAERRGVEFDQSTWTGAGKRELDREEAAQVSRWNTLDTRQKLYDWAMRNQYKIILGSWAASMVVAGALVYGNKYQTPAQKVVQARMWAQGLTVGVMIGAGILTHSQRAEAAKHRDVDHSWASIVSIEEEEERERALAQSKLRLLNSTPAHSP
ncbi:hypothetical protein BKA93DRAFT_821322 [Sparassis latifolia]|uniref:Respiratory supercomplex factor 2, mitochondrial n=1 Tax=Sparassis crispa TaxID=139825 RepID=A0A401GBP8_9APHY|nr:Respiratory supercomplex factor 2, mitochondrial [Sparassis crispa]GBE79616.1 Respiratory supercomplex factor 2, mitochondrial [Sparassis crispa]